MIASPTITMPAKTIDICPFRLEESYDTIYNLQGRLKLSDDYLLSASRGIGSLDPDYSKKLDELDRGFNKARDDLITAYIKKPSVELNVAISLVTAKMKFIEYKLGKCDGLDLHQACSLSLVNFCNILADMTVLNVDRKDRKTMHMVSNQAGIPVWLSHYRNQICHVPSESPCISILVPLVVKALAFMKDSFWTQVLSKETFDPNKCKRVIRFIMACTHIKSINGREMSTDMNSDGKLNPLKVGKYCSAFRRLVAQYPGSVLELVIENLKGLKPKNKKRSFTLLFEQIVLARQFERFLDELLNFAEKEEENKVIFYWLWKMFNIAGHDRKFASAKRRKSKQELGLSPKISKWTDVSPLKCSHLAYRLLNLDGVTAIKLMYTLRDKLPLILGKQQTTVLMKLVRAANR